jgi:hypothetical protein
MVTHSTVHFPFIAPLILCICSKVSVLGCVQCGQTALIWASWKGHTAIAQALIGAGADLDLQDEVSDCACSYKCLCCEQDVGTACVCIRCVVFLSFLFGRTCCCVSDVIGLDFAY